MKFIVKKINYLIIFLLLTISCKKDNLDSEHNKLIYRFIVNNQVYEYKYNYTQIIRIIYPSGEICNLDYKDSIITYVTSDYSKITEIGYYQLNKYGNVILKCAYKNNDSIFTKYNYDNNQYFIKDSTWHGTFVSYSYYNMSGITNYESYDGIDYTENDFIIFDQINKEQYVNYIDWQHFGLAIFGIPLQNLPIKETIFKQNADCTSKDGSLICTIHYGTEYYYDYIYKYDLENRIIERKKLIKLFNNGSIIDSTIIKIEYIK
jgi:hypothetical protein